MRQRREIKLKATFRRTTWIASAFVGVIAIGLTLIFNFTDNEKVYAAVNGEFRSKASGNWNAITTWQRYSGGAWNNATAIPVITDKAITILSGHTVTVTSDVTADQIVVDNGGILSIASGKKLILNNGSGCDLSINGTIKNAGEVSLSTSAFMEVNSTGLYQHTHTTTKGIIPTSTWNAGSTCEIIGYTTNPDGPDNMTQSFSNFSWNCTSQLSEVKLKGTLKTVVNNLSIKSTGLTGSLTINEIDGYILNVGGDLTVSGGNIKFNDRMNGTPILNVDGNFTLSGGTFNLAGNDNSTTNLNVKGNWNHSVGTLSATGSASVAEVNFVKSGSQTFTTLLQLTSGSIDYNINSGSTLKMGTSIMLGRNFSLNAGGTLEIGSLVGLIGNIQVTGTKTYSPDGSYTYSGATGQDLGSTSALTAKNLTINNGSTTTLATDVTVSGILNLANGKINTGSNTIYLTNNSPVSLTGYSSSNYIIGNLSRAIASSGTYNFPLGTATNYELAKLTLVSTVGVSRVLGSFTATNPNNDGYGLDSINADGVQMSEFLNYGYWTLTPNSSLTSGTFTVELNQTGHTNAILEGSVITMASRPTSTSAWINRGTHNNAFQAISAANASAQRSGLNTFGIFVIAIGEYVSFTNSSLISGTAGQVNAVYLFPLVVRGVDAWVRIVSLNNGATLDDIDASSVGYKTSFQPFINYPANNTSYIEWLITFKKTGTATDTTLDKVTATGIDVDGSNSDGKNIREFIEATMPTSYNLDPYTNLTVANNFGNYRAIGSSTTISNIDTTAKQAMFELNYINVNTLLYRTGAINTFNTSEIRQTSLFFKAFNLSNKNIALPIELISFDTKLKNNNVIITWATAAEVNNDYFTIERSVDGETFEPLFTQRGAGNSTVTIEYEANDPNPLEGYSYYRLKQTDFDGKFSYSDVQTIKNKGGNDIDEEQINITAISPNPFTDEFKIDYILKQKTEVEISMYSTKGELIFKEITLADDGYNSYTYIDSKGLTSGYYFVTIAYKDQKVTKKIVKN